MTYAYVVVREDFIVNNGSHTVSVEQVFTNIDYANQYCFDLAFDEYEWDSTNPLYGRIDWKYIPGYSCVDPDCGHIVLTFNNGDWISFYVQRSELA